MYETSCQSRFEAGCWMLGAGALGRPRGMVPGGRREEGSGWGTRVYLWRIHVAIWQNQYNIVKLKNKIKTKKESSDNQRLAGSPALSPFSLSLYLPRSCILPRFLPSSFERIKIASLHHLLAEREEAQTHSVHRYQQDDTSPSFVIKKA